MALFDGGAVYTSYANLNVTNSLFNNNTALYNDSRGFFGGAIFFDRGMFFLDSCSFVNSSAKCGGAFTHITLS